MTKIADFLKPDDIKHFTQANNLKASWMLAWTWISIIAIFYVTYRWPNPLTIILALVLLGGRALALGVILHDCAHGVFFSSKSLNKFVGQWLTAAPAFTSLNGYKNFHIPHHQLAGTKDDPDLHFVKGYPTSKSSMRRKFWRDLNGTIGWPAAKYIFKTAMDIFSDDEKKRKRAKPFAQEMLVNLFMFLALSYYMAPWVYALWVIAYFTTHMMILRIRVMGEHGGMELLNPDPRKHARTTIPTWWERILIAPNYINYHLEHHFMASVPSYNLPSFHEFLKSRGFYQDTPIVYGYIFGLLPLLSNKEAATA